MSQNDDRSNGLTRRDALRKGALTAGVFVVGGTAASTIVAAGDTKTGFVRKSDFDAAFEIGSLVEASDVVSDVVLETPERWKRTGNGVRGELTEANVLRFELSYCYEYAPSRARDYCTQPRGNTEFWPLDGVSEVGTRMRIADAEAMVPEATVKLMGPAGPIESVDERMMRVEFQEVRFTG